MSQINRWHIVQGLIALSVVYDCVQHRRVKKTTMEIVEANDELHEIIAIKNAQMHYLAHLINEHGVHMDEFDYIVLNSPILPEKELE